MSGFCAVDIPYTSDSTVLYDKVCDEPWSVYLDSCQPDSVLGRFDIIVSRPSICFVTRDNETTIQTYSESYVVPDDPFDLLKDHLKQHKKNPYSLPFIGGALGFFSYDLGRRIEVIPSLAENDLSLPNMVIGIYKWVVVVDHKKRKTMLIGDKSDVKTRREWSELVNLFSTNLRIQDQLSFSVTEEVSSNMTAEYYKKAFDRIKNYIRDGDCYQVNLAQRFEVSVEGSSWEAYKKLRKINPSPFGAYLNYSDYQILCNSPERFLSVKNNVVETKPIKGTRPRSTIVKKDKSLKLDLEMSKKDQAENVMIVDLLRNDISKNCKLDSIKVPSLFNVETFSNVHHLVSTVTGELRKCRTAIDLLYGCFPGGSITGAPKLRSMEIIEELEPHRRGVYCGSIGYIGFDGNMDMNIAIRTIVHKNKKMYFYVGGGIVHDSIEQDEYQETFDKATAIMQLLNQGKNYAVGH